MPHKEYWKGDERLVISPFRNYTVNDYDDLFRDIHFEKGIILRRNTESLMNVSAHDCSFWICEYLRYLLIVYD